MAELEKKWYVLKAISGKELKVKEYLEADARNNGLEDALIEDYPDSIITYQPPDPDTGDYILDMTLEDEELFTLPETGSWGTEMIISVGVLLLVAAAGCIILRLHKKEGAETP